MKRRGADMRVLHLSQSDVEGGANRAAFRLHRALLSAGIDSVFAAGRRHMDVPDVISAGPGDWASRFVTYANAATVKPFRRRSGSGLISPGVFAYGRPDSAAVATADIVCLHWIAGAFLKPRNLRAFSGKPVVWRLSDVWPFTGGCHYPGRCRRYENRCGCCPQLGSGIDNDITRHGWLAKQRGYRDLDLTVVAPSRWIAESAAKSSLFADRNIEVIPTGVDTSHFRPRDRASARADLGLPADRHLILFGALGATTDPRKGFAELSVVLERLGQSPSAADITLVVFGDDGGPPGMADGHMPKLLLGRIDDRERLATLYAAADVLICPSLEDNLPNVTLEALACGTPIVAFAIGGMPDIVDDRVCGRLVPANDTAAMADAVSWVVREAGTGTALRQAARSKAETQFDLGKCAERYRALFRKLLAKR